MIVLLGVSSHAEIWPPFGQLTPNNYIPPPSCKYEQERVYEDIIEEVCTTEEFKDCKMNRGLKLELQCEKVTQEVCNENDCDFDKDEECKKCDEKKLNCRDMELSVFEMVVNGRFDKMCVQRTN